MNLVQFRAALLLGAVTVPAFALAQNPATTTSLSPEVTISVYDYADVPTPLLAAAEDQARRIFGRAGLGTVWQNCFSKPEKFEPQSCYLADPTHLTLKIGPHAITPDVRSRIDVLGASYLDKTGTGFFAYVFYDRVQELAQRRRLGQALLGDVMAHEIGHLLLGSASHSTTGIMCERWNHEELRDVAQGAMFVNPTQSRIMRDRLLVRQGKQMDVAALVADPGSDTPQFLAQDQSAPVAAETEIPFVLYLDHMIVVEGRIGPLTHLRFTLDTGATHSVVDRKIADALKLERRPGTVFNLDDFAAIEWADFPSIAIGPIEVKNGSLMVGDLVHVDALIGMDLLRMNERLRIDYKSGQVVFTPGAAAASQTLSTPDPACLTVDVSVQGKPLRLIVDTGIEGILLYRDRIFQRNPKLLLENEAPPSRDGGHLLPGRETVRNIQLPSGDFSARIFLIATAPENALPNIDGYLATAALRARELDFDFSRHRFSWK